MRGTKTLVRKLKKQWVRKVKKNAKSTSYTVAWTEHLEQLGQSAEAQGLAYYSGPRSDPSGIVTATVRVYE